MKCYEPNRAQYISRFPNIENLEKMAWHRLLYFQEYVTVQPQPQVNKPRRPGQRSPVPSKVLQTKQFSKGFNDLTNKIDELIQNHTVSETIEQGVLLMTAIQNGNAPMVKLLVEAGHPINFMGDNRKTPIKLAVEKGDREIISILLNHGAEWDGV